MKEEKFPHTREPLHWQGCEVGRREASELRRRVKQQGCRGQSGETPAQRIGADQHSAIWDASLLTCRGRWGLGAEAQASEIRSQGEDWGWLLEDRLKGARAPQLAGRASGKMSGPAGEARDHCFRVQEERGFLPCLPTEGRALPKRAPEMGQATAISSDPKDGHDILTLLSLLPRILRASTGQDTLPRPPPHPRELVQHATARIPRSRDSFPRRTHGAPQAAAMSCWPLPLQAQTAFQLWLLYPTASPALVSKRALISRCFNPLLSGWGTDPWGQPTCRIEAKTKAEPQELCE